MKKTKPAYPRIRVLISRKTGGAHLSIKGGKYRRSQKKEEDRKNIRAELD